MRIVFLLLFAPLFAHAQLACDTIFKTVDAACIYSPSLDSLGFDESQIAYACETPKYFLYQSKLPNDQGAYRFALKEGKTWKSWKTAIHSPEKGAIKCNRKDVSKGGVSELIVWEMHVNGNNSREFKEEHLRYTVHIWDVLNARLVFKFLYRDYHRNYPSWDSIASPIVDIEYDLHIYTELISISEKKNTRLIVGADSSEQNNCKFTKTNFVLKNNAWVKTPNVKLPKTVNITAPPFIPFWEKQPPSPLSFKERFKLKWKKIFKRNRKK
jgi:hypothetical protein